ncbi:MAG: hypothetical protein HWQ41_23440 [Nostoc sp. NOS(2021)]|uniref:hypothetical protein n=1 Tax=Nostoc sp. NOS(2021) TaxID=2815407 RepID=UPI0025FEC357|nr:hypothetical protein [Nostoc sp. NOS(2021)]MBN3898116.1 hypothetical protein [Nostoc sp. NOS(2021)]
MQRIAFISGKFDQFQRNIPYSAIAAALQKMKRTHYAIAFSWIKKFWESLPK